MAGARADDRALTPAVWVPAGLATVAVLMTLAGGLWTAGHLHPDPALHHVALFAHLVSLVLGFGSVLAVDWVALQWVAQRRTLADVVATAEALHVLIWAGYAGLVLSGILLEPDLARPSTQVKLALVLVIGWNGIAATVLQRLLVPQGASASVDRRVLLISAGAATISQVGWWGALVIGFLNGR